MLQITSCPTYSADIEMYQISIVNEHGAQKSWKVTLRQEARQIPRATASLGFLEDSTVLLNVNRTLY